MFQVVSQSSDILSFLKNWGGFQATNGWEVRIGCATEVDIPNKIIYLWGNDPNQYKLRVHRIWDLSTNFARDEFIAEIDIALKQLIASVNGDVRVNPELSMWKRPRVAIVEGNFDASKKIARAS